MGLPIGLSSCFSNLLIIQHSIGQKLISVSFGADNIFLRYKIRIARPRLHALDVTWFLDLVTRGRWGDGGIMYLIGV